MHGLMSYRRFGRARPLRSDRAEHELGRCVATLFELLSDVSCFLRKAFHVNFVATVFDSNIWLVKFCASVGKGSRVRDRGLYPDEMGVVIQRDVYVYAAWEFHGKGKNRRLWV
ncbi:hypothetical protein DY000_02061387 [Brassica cretica]|uniref:Uncharacterized protein n=1 Tax=Brassica cretica TaxID=69181 RepID=A0ABQ7AX27_BRACR|nr:hypothetical protein DY000_02061387 [Brassica cretica]